MNVMNKRIEAFVIDAIVLFVVSSSFLLLGVWFNNNMLWMSFVLALIYSFLFCKDVNGGKSIGKQKAGLCILSDKDESVPSATKLILRNVFYILWPIEIILVFCNSGKRLGDLVMQTKVVACNKESDATFRPTFKYIYSILVMTIVLFILFFGICKLAYKISPLIHLLYS